MSTKSTLHIVNHQPGNCSEETSFLDGLTSGDGIILTENGVYWLTAKNFADLQPAVNNGVKVHALTSDIQARGLEHLIKTDEFFTQCDYVEFVELTTQYENVVSWS
ncbi:MAG: sulfurtransferase complex subunit TusB [Pseudomonadales bacterium]|nr:sulfurtransferase complex subunit TusB [Pseudomonadales bacterium]